ncbi:MAG: ATP-binding cassette domain-containing protein [Flavobacteriaceae bacterium]|nr:ATP-binding cassette domain-containing protein [Flavobacteriaceae bacterium]MDH3796100.1 ATP-binding cassette domain-containing protein [Flavobacteriaceae bacterium]
MRKEHWAIFVTNTSKVSDFTERLLRGEPPVELQFFKGKRGVLFSQKIVDVFIEEESKHDIKILNRESGQELKTYSSGERKKALLAYLLEQDPQFMILDNPFDNLDLDSQIALKTLLEKLSDRLFFVQLASRKGDVLTFIHQYGQLQNGLFKIIHNPKLASDLDKGLSSYDIPRPLESHTYEHEFLVRMQGVNVSYGEKKIVSNIDWEIRPGEFWQLAGPNGSGKTTLLSLITGDNPKAYGQDLFLFGYQKGEGESVWDIKEVLGYFTPAITDRFRGYHSLEHMLISGLFDSIGLYVQPSKRHRQLALEWLQLLGMEERAKDLFASLSAGEKRLIMCARAMIKHPLLLILDEPTAGLDDISAALVVDLVNKVASNSNTAIVFVSHRKEAGLTPDHTLELIADTQGSRAVLI